MLRIDHTTCLSCSGCISLCPETALWHDLNGLQVKDDDCTLCHICVKFCPVGALEISLGLAAETGGER